MLEISKNRSIADAYRRVIESSTFENVPEWRKNMIDKANRNRKEEALNLTPEKFAADLVKSEDSGAVANLSGKSRDLILSTLPNGDFERPTIIVFEKEDSLDSKIPPTLTIEFSAYPIDNYGGLFMDAIAPFVEDHANWMKFDLEKHAPEEAVIRYSTTAPEVLNKFFKLTGQNDRRTDFKQADLF